MNDPSHDEVRILAADDHAMLRGVLCHMLAREPGLRIVAQASDGPETVALCEQTRPDVVLLDLEMPGPGALSTLRRIRTAVPGIRVIVVSMHDDQALLQSLLEEGAVGYVHKCAPYEFLLTAIHGVMSGGQVIYVPQGGTRAPATTVALGDAALPEPYEPGPAPPAAGTVEHRAPTSALTPREREVLQCVAEAMSNRQIGRRLNIAEATVKRHLRSVFAKLDANSRLDAVNKGIATGAMH
ncbi:response regulator transcription factor [Streptomyces flaveolus]|uniref:response regulator transcription factor n=1 Tax=Streptomyces flaveolus TaxID=67297 RepID=UPI00340041F6